MDIRHDTLRADWVLVDAGRVLRDGWVRIRGGRIAAVGRGGTSGTRVGTLLAPGCVNAHVHLDLTDFDRLPRERDFAAWIRALLAAKAGLAPADVERSVAAGVAESLAAGTTCVGDVVASGVVEARRDAPLRVVAFREWIAPTADRARAGWTAQGIGFEDGDERFRAGLSPHAPYSVAAEGLRTHVPPPVPVQMHVAETAEEERWLRTGRGPLAELLGDLGVPGGSHAAWGDSVLGFLDAAGWLSPRFSVAHGNFLRPAELALLARRGGGLVHCPGTHAYFERARDPLALARALRVPWGIGSDGKVTGGALDLRYQGRLGLRAHPEIPPHAWFHAATAGGARVLGLGRVGRLLRGHAADLVAFDGPRPRRAADVHRAWLDRDTAVAGVWIAGLPLGSRSH